MADILSDWKRTWQDIVECCMPVSTSSVNVGTRKRREAVLHADNEIADCKAALSRAEAENARLRGLLRRVHDCPTFRDDIAYEADVMMIEDIDAALEGHDAK